MATASKLRRERLGALATETGQFAILALDHVASMATTIRPDDPESVSAAEVIATKARMIDALAKHATGLLIDPGYVTSPDIMATPIRGAGGLIVGIEDGDYVDVHALPRRLPGWSVARAADLGADAVKISVYFDPHGDTAVAEHFVADVVAECVLTDMPLFCEPLVLNGADEDRRSSVLEGIKRFGALGPDVLKIQFPEAKQPKASDARSIEACEEADALSPVPWTLLSEGEDYGLFKGRLEIACRAGASGFLGGRAVWSDAVTGRSDVEISVARLAELSTIATTFGRDWKARVRAADQAPKEGSS